MSTIKEVTERYNALAEKLGKPTVKRFKDKPTAEARLAELQGQHQASKPGRKPSIIDWPYTGPGKGEPSHRIRKGSLREDFVNELREGATMDRLVSLLEIHDAGQENGLEPTAARVRGTLRMLHVYNGYGIKQTGDTFKLVTR